MLIEKVEAAGVVGTEVGVDVMNNGVVGGHMK
jgi:hypothetical protein